MMGKKALATAIVAITVLSMALTAGTAGAKARGKAILLVLDGIGLTDISEARPVYLEKLIRSGGIGLMNPHSARNGDAASGYLTIGAGAPADATIPGGGSELTAGLAFGGDTIYEGRPAAEAYRDQNRGKITADSVVVLAAPLLARQNEEEDYGAKPGLLAKMLKAANKKSGVVGNADSFSQYHREAALIAMDERGLVAEGEVGRELLTPDPRKPFGLKTDQGKLLNASLKLLEKTDLLVIELGDSSRANAYADFLSEEALNRERKTALWEGDAFLGRLLKAREGKNDLIMVVSPNPPKSLREKPGQLTPLIVAGPGIGSGLLTSPTTRRSGLVTNADIAPTILQYLGAGVSPQMSGRPLEAIGEKDPLGFLLRSEKKIVSISEQRKPILTAYVATVFVLLILGALSLLLPLETYLLQAIQFLLLWSLAVPLSLLLLPLFPTTELSVTALLAASLAGASAALSWMATRNHLRAAGMVALVTALFISADILLGAPLMKSSLLGYDPIIGARFYGLGNEYMGVLIGSALAGSAILLDTYRRRRKLLLSLTGMAFLLLILLIAHPQLGAKVGGIIAATAAFLVAIVRLQGGKLTIRNSMLIGAAVLVVLSFFVGFDYFRSASSQSHAGKAVSLIQKEGTKSALDIIKRKVATNLKLIQWTIWSKLFIISLLIFAVVFAKPVGIFKGIMAEHPDVTSGIYAIIAGSIVALIFNDSGVVAAATMIIFGVIPLLYLVMERGKGLT